MRLFLVTVEGEIAAGPIAAAVAQSGHGLRSATVAELRGADEAALRLAPHFGSGHLTRRQRQILALRVIGHGVRAIAAQAGINERTVRGQLSEAYRRLGVQDAAGATVEALRRGWIRAAEEGS